MNEYAIDDAVIYDIETLSQDQHRGVIVSMAILTFNVNRIQTKFDYKYDDLISKTKFIKFDVTSQVKKHGRNICSDTLNWWKSQGPEAQKQLLPSSDDRDISELYGWFVENVMLNNLKVAYTRNNTFDPVYVQFLCQQFGHTLPHKWWITRDVKSTLDGMTWGQSDIKDDFIPYSLEEKFVKHDPRHDIAMDVMRLQYVSEILLGEIPF